MEAASSVNVLGSCFCILVREPIGGGNLNVNFRLLGDDGDSGTCICDECSISDPIERLANSLAIAIAESRLFSSDADIGLTLATKKKIESLIIRSLLVYIVDSRHKNLIIVIKLLIIRNINYILSFIITKPRYRHNLKISI